MHTSTNLVKASALVTCRVPFVFVLGGSNGHERMQSYI